MPFAAVGQDALEGEINAVEILRSDVDQMARNIAEIAGDDAALVALAVRADKVEQSLIAKGVELSPRLAQIKSRLDQLGPVPAEGQPAELEIVANERKLLADQRAAINQLLGVLEDESIRTKKILDQVSEARRALFTGSLSRRYDISDAFSAELFEDVADRTQQLNTRLSSWANFTWRFKRDAVLGATAALIVLMLASIFGARKTFAPWIYRDPMAIEPSYFQRLTTAFWFTILPTLAMWAFLLFAYGVLQYSGILRPDIASMLATLIAAFGIVFLVWRLSEGVFAPQLPQWRLLNVSDHSAGPLKAFVLAMVFVATADVVITNINSIVGTSVSITIAKSLVTSIAVGTLLILIAFLRPFLISTGILTQGGAPWPRYVKVLLCVAGGGLIISALAGYIGFARFVAQQVVVTGAVLATMLLGYRAAHAITGEKALQNTRVGQQLLNKYSFSDVGLDRLGLLIGFGMIAMVLTVGLPVLALLWGFQWADVQRFTVRFFTNIQIGSITISITSILVGIALFVAGLFLTRRFQKWLDGGLLSRSGIEVGAQNSIRTIIGYTGIAVAGLLGVSAAGLQLSQLALVAGALSLGIGFGLQNIVSNFVSGLILLFERPFKAGDIIEAGAFTGTVKNIKVRATEIETFDRKTLILPNSELINAAVVNWVHKTTLGRIEIPVGVSYDSDPQQVRDLLLEIADDHPRILSKPEPFVEFINFGDSSLDFVLRGFLADIGFGPAVRTELRIAIFQRFKAVGIEIPFPQRDVNLTVKDGKISEILGNTDSGAFGVIKTGKKRILEED
ncbi:MAG: mechanosensitive ion channel [Ahrensia sp.]|nr:mechanosensitive ion channel [Ahrensia sp.]